MRLAKEETYRVAGLTLRRSPGGEIFASQDMQTLGSMLHKLCEKWISKEKQQQPEYEPDFVQAMVQASRQLGLSEADRDLGQKLFEALRVRIPVSRVLYPDTLSTLQTLRQRGYTLGIVTNRNYGGQPFYEDLRHMGLLEYFEYQHMAISADLGIRKPHPAIFKYALEHLSVLPEEAAMVGDNLQADVGGARQLNILGIWKPKPAVRKTSSREQVDIVPDLTIEDLKDLLEIF